MAFSEKPPRARWPRGQRFSLSPLGVDAALAFGLAMQTARDNTGRGAFDTASASWGVQFGVQGDDGVFLAEVRSGHDTLRALVDALAGADKTKAQTEAAVGRLVDRGLLVLAQSP